MQYEKNKNVILPLDPMLIKYHPEIEKFFSVQSLLQVLRKVPVLMHVNMLHATVHMGVLKFKVLILISPTVQWYILTSS